ncbi:spermidine/putrescine transport system permease protein [Roseiarcus fermentans]|uniref:Spermidine/putrescine transport system permease protein n=1 Tax=Roseiarcus fermentans TaxID=1473586 RepID=A0A366F260_9HYPH|nr:ABC transporter permease [Roseiarcus fermentans]RBP08694.1 spermidine/putrescine transport system permease protein [Roseiarcus fermentans]
MDGGRTFLAATVGPVLVALIVLCLAPLGVLLVVSFFRVDFVSIVPDPSLHNYAQVLSSGSYRYLIAKALMSGATIAAITAVIAYPVAFFIAKRIREVKAALLTALLIPLYTGDLVRIFAWRLILGREGVLNSFLIWTGAIDRPIETLLFSPTATTIVLVYNYLPFMVLGLWLSFETLDDHLFEAAADLGAGRTTILLRLVLPLTAPGLVAGALMVFALVVGDFITPQLIGGASGVTVISAIADLFGAAFDWPLGSAIAWTLLVAMVGVVAAVVVILGRTPWGSAAFGRG